MFFSEVSGSMKVVCFRNMADWIISHQWYHCEMKLRYFSQFMTTKNPDEETKCIIETVAKVIKNKMKKFLQSNATGSTIFYPSIDYTKIGWISGHFCLFLSSFIRSELKVDTIGQCLMKSAMPRSAIPLMLFSLPIEPNHTFATRWLNSQLFNLGCTELYNDMFVLNREWS